MPQPHSGLLHVDAPLTNISIAYRNDAAGFVADKVFPVVPVAKQSDLYFTYTANDWFRDEAQLRGNNMESAGGGYTMSTGSYYAKVYAFHKDIGLQDLANADAPIDLEADAARFVMDRLLLKREVNWAANFFTTSKWTTDTTVSNKWSDFTASDPLNDMETAKDTIYNKTGKEPNVLVLGRLAFRRLKIHPDIKDLVKYTNGAEAKNITEQVLAQVFGVDKVLVAKALKATNNENETAAMSAAVDDDSALLVYAAPSPSLLAPSGGYIFSWTGLSQGMGADVAMTSFDIQETKSRRIEGEIAFDPKLIGADLGVFFPDCVD